LTGFEMGVRQWLLGHDRGQGSETVRFDGGGGGCCCRVLVVVQLASCSCMVDLGLFCRGSRAVLMECTSILDGGFEGVPFCMVVAGRENGGLEACYSTLSPA
jgi:hypothetical protein